MKIVFLISSLSSGGAENVLCTLANRMAEDGEDVHVISLEKRKQFYELNSHVTLHKIEKKGGKFARDFRFIRKTIQSVKPDVTVSFLYRCNVLMLIQNLFTRRKIIVCDRNNPLREHSKVAFYISQLLYLRANAVFVQTNQIKQYYFKTLQKKIFVIENPIDTERLHGQIQNRRIVKNNTVISIGRLEKQKDFQTLIKAFNRVVEKHPGWRLKIFGVGPMKNELRKLIQDNQLNGKVLLCGQTKEPFFELSRASVFVLSTHYEGFPNVLCEAMEAGLPCIASDCVSGPRELIQNGENGWLFKIGDIGELEKRINYCIENDVTHYGKKAHDSVQRLKLTEIMRIWKDYIYMVAEKTRVK